MIREHLSYANVISTTCLFLLLGGGAYAASQLPKNSVGAKQIKKKSITFAKLAPSTTQKLTGATGSSGTQGLEGPQGPPGPTGPSDLYVTHNTSEFVELEENTALTIQSLTLPPGKYLVTVHQGLFAALDIPSGYVECRLSKGGGPSLTRSMAAEDYNDMGLSSSVSLSETTILTDSCEVFEGVGEMNAGTMTMTAIQVGEIHEQAAPPTG